VIIYANIHIIYIMLKKVNFLGKKEKSPTGKNEEEALMPFDRMEKKNLESPHHEKANDVLNGLSSRSMVCDFTAIQGELGKKDSSLTPPSQSGASHRRNSQNIFASKEQTVIVFDWDDTLFPTTWVRHEKGLHWRYPIDQQTKFPKQEREQIKQQLDKVSEEVERLLRLAGELGHVVIVTLAREPWVDLSVANFFSRVGKLIKRKNISVVYAQDMEDSQEYNKAEFKSDEEAEIYWIRKKQRAIQGEITKFYESSGSSWKNVISIGDSNFERMATIRSMEDYAKDKKGEVNDAGETSGSLTVSDSKGFTDEMCKSGTIGNHYRRLRTKTVKMFDSPNIEDLSTEMSMLYKWLPYLVQKDSGFDVDLEDDDKLYGAHKELTGEDLM